MACWPPLWPSLPRSAPAGDRPCHPGLGLGGYRLVVGPLGRPHQVVGLVGVRTHTSKNAVRSCPETSSYRASKSSVVAVPLS